MPLSLSMFTLRRNLQSKRQEQRDNVLFIDSFLSINSIVVVVVVACTSYGIVEGKGADRLQTALFALIKNKVKKRRLKENELDSLPISCPAAANEYMHFGRVSIGLSP